MQHEPWKGEDALGIYRFWLLPLTELLDRVGWSTRADLALQLRDDQSRRIAAMGAETASVGRQEGGE